MTVRACFTCVAFVIATACQQARDTRLDDPLPVTEDAGRRDAGRPDAGQAIDGGQDTDAGPAVLSGIGGPCRSVAECEDIPGGSYCLTSTEAASLGFSAPGGYCTSLSCDPENPVALCGGGTICGPLLQSGNACEQACHVLADCRTGYECKAGGCVPLFRMVPSNPPDAGPLPICGPEGSSCCGGTACYRGLYCIGGTCQVCDHTFCSGACVDTSQDNHNCGHCGATCSDSMSCFGGHCMLSACTGSQTLCPGTTDNYCADLSSDSNNCGSCGHRCSSTTATMKCEGGACHITQCVDGQTDCDGNPDNGCEYAGQCPDGTYDTCSYPNNCLYGNWCISNGLSGLHACMHPCGQDSDCPQDQYCIERLNTGAMTCAFHCSHGYLNQSTGAILLGRPPIDRSLDWEDFDLLRIAGRQVASYLAEARAHEALADARRFDEFNRRFAFIMHDVKNLVSQLTLVARNAERHADNPEFRADMIATLRDSVGRMNDLLARLSQHNSGRVEEPVAVELMPIVERVTRRRGTSHPIAVTGKRDAVAVADPARLEQALGHLIQNAIEASRPGEPVGIVVGAATIAIVDKGAGMSASFVRDRLFRPFVSTKDGGFGIGAFEARQVVQAMGGRLDVVSREGEGTRFTIVLREALAPTKMERAA